MIGEPAVQPARAVLANTSAATFTRIAGARTLQEVAVRHPELRDRAVSLLIEQLRDWPEQDDSLNGFLIDYLVELHAVEAAPLMQAAFEAGLADPDIRGDWEDVQIELGLLRERLTPRPPLRWLTLMNQRASQAEPPVRPVTAGEKARKRRKAEKQARKRNRRK
jgi:hypothetical protein